MFRRRAFPPGSYVAPIYAFQDEFVSGTLDITKWTRENLGYGYGALETFTSDADLATISGGNLLISAIKDQTGAKPWRAGFISTRNHFTMRTGSVEFRAALPTLAGAWPAIWLHNNINGESGANTRAEIDIMELFPGGGPSGQGAYLNIHDWVHSPQVGEGLTPNVAVMDGQFHVWKVSWDRFGIQLWIDGASQGIITPAMFAALGGDFTVFTSTDFKIILDIAVGASFSAAVPPAGATRLDMAVDYIRVVKTS